MMMSKVYCFCFNQTTQQYVYIINSDDLLFAWQDLFQLIPGEEFNNRKVHLQDALVSNGYVHSPKVNDQDRFCRTNISSSLNYTYRKQTSE